jgi:DNA-binding response OmpR family regulator
MRDLLLDPQTFRVTFREQSVVLTRIEFRLLEQLLSTNKGVLGRQDLLSRVWGPRVSVEIRTVDSHMVRLRRKLQQLGDQGLTIETVWGVGYRMSIIDDSFFPS